MSSTPSSSSSSSSASCSCSSFSETSDSDNNFVENVLLAMPKQRVFRNRNNPVEMYEDCEFKQRYRLDKETVYQICDIIGANLESETMRNKPLSAMDKILITLRFYATGSFQQVLADHINVSQPTVSRIIPAVTRALESLREQFIKMPTTHEERRKIQLELYSIHHFPCVVGAIDCTHVRIQSPGGLLEILAAASYKTNR